MQNTLSILLWRDSVCAGDDGDAPHELVLEVSCDLSLRDLVNACLARHYLASIRGDKATWILGASRPLAVIAQQWFQPRFLVPPESPVSSLIDVGSRLHLNFRYCRQLDPDQVLDRLLRGEDWRRV